MSMSHDGRSKDVLNVLIPIFSARLLICAAWICIGVYSYCIGLSVGSHKLGHSRWVEEMLKVWKMNTPAGFVIPCSSFGGANRSRYVYIDNIIFIYIYNPKMITKRISSTGVHQVCACVCLCLLFWCSCVCAQKRWGGSCLPRPIFQMWWSQSTRSTGHPFFSFFCTLAGPPNENPKKTPWEDLGFLLEQGKLIVFIRQVLSTRIYFTIMLA